MLGVSAFRRLGVSVFSVPAACVVDVSHAAPRVYDIVHTGALTCACVHVCEHDTYTPPDMCGVRKVHVRSSPVLEASSRRSLGSGVREDQNHGNKNRNPKEISEQRARRICSKSNAPLFRYAV